MRDPFSWSVPLARVAGITVRVHILFPVVAAALILRVGFHKPELVIPAGAVIDAAVLMGILFVSVLLHEFGHCFAARSVHGDAQEILIWPLGGLASVEIPHRPRPHFVVAVAGPATNLGICLLGWLLLAWLTRTAAVEPPMNPFWNPYRLMDATASHPAVLTELFTWDGRPLQTNGYQWSWNVALAARTFWMNWVLFLLNVVLVGFPLDGGRILQSLLWPWYGFRQATMYAIVAGFVTMVVVAIIAIARDEVLTLCLALFIYATCRQQWILLESGGEDSVFGYDFSQGYTSLEDASPAPRRRNPGFWQRWRQRRASRRLDRDEEQRRLEERRMDELLEKVQRVGLAGLTEEEQRFLKRVSDRYKNRQ